MKKLIYSIVLLLFSISIFYEALPLKFKCPTFSVCCRARGLNNKEVYNYVTNNNLPFFELFNKSKNSVNVIVSNDPNRLLQERERGYLPVKPQSRAIGFNKDARNKLRPTTEAKIASEIDNALDPKKDVYIRISYQDSSKRSKNKIFNVKTANGLPIYLSFQQDKLLYPQTGMCDGVSCCGDISVTESLLVQQTHSNLTIKELTLDQLNTEASREQPSSEGFAGFAEQERRKEEQRKKELESKAKVSSESIPMPTNETDAYKVLELPYGAPYEEVKKSFRKLQLKWHPDKNLDKPKLALENTQSINRAHEILKNKFGK